MNVLLLAPEFLPIWGGVGSYVVELSRNLPKDVNIHIVAPQRFGFKNEALSTDDYNLETIFPDNVQIHFISEAYDTFMYNAKFQYACFKCLPKLIKREKIDLIHTHTAQMPDILLQFRNIDIPVVTTLHTTIKGQRKASSDSGLRFSQLEFSEKATYLLYPLLVSLEYIYHQKKRNYIAVSQWTKNQVVDSYNIDPSSIEVIHNGVNTDNFCPKNGKNSHDIFPKLEDIDVPVVLSTSRLIGAKGASFLLKAIPKILDEVDAHFLFAGTGKIGFDIPEDSFSYVGYVDYLKMPYLYASSDIFILSSLYENFPMSVLESMSSGIATISTEVGGVPEIIKNGKNGLLIPRRDVDAIADSIIKLVNNDSNRKKIGKKARKDVEKNFDWKNVANKVKNSYEKAIA
ncbi:MAG: glycosyltransferase family 4 protein [Methanobacterium sp.]|nr:glycosyltransferase family 4 protein [Methanobacterium sp.]